MNVSPLPPYVRCISGWLKDNSGSLIGAGGNLLGGITSGIFSLIQANKQRDWEEDMYARQLADTRQMRDESWARQDAQLADERAYNSPANQIKLAREAGLNPALTQGGQLTDALTSVSASGTSPDAPNPGSYTPAALPSSLASIGTAAISAQAQSKEIQIAQQNADTAKYQAETQRLRALIQNSRDMADAKYISAGTDRRLLENFIMSTTLDERISMVREQLNGMRWDNLIKGFDFTSMRPAVLAKIQAGTNLIDQQISESISRQNLIGSEIMLNEQHAFESASRAYYYDSQVPVAQAQATYIQALEETLRAKLPFEEYKGEHYKLTYWMDMMTQGVSSVGILLGGVGNVVSRGAVSGTSKVLGKAASKTPNVPKPKRQLATPLVRDKNNRPIEANGTRIDWNLFQTIKNNRSSDPRYDYLMQNDPFFRDQINPYLK